MDLKERIQNLPNLLFKISKFDPGALNELSSIYSEAFKKTLNISCGNCRIRAYQELINLDLTQLKIMENNVFKLKKDQQIFHNNQHYIQSTLTDEVAMEVLQSNPAFLALFEDYPKDENGNVMFPEPEDNTDDSRAMLTDEEKVLVYKKDKTFFLKKEDGNDEKLTQKFLKANGIDPKSFVE